ncbi:MAG: Crp/Fnr family transcriptional regulator [Chitinophagaceae bacterium]
MTIDKKMLLIRNYDLWNHISDEEYVELNFVHNYIEAKKGAYIYFEAFNHNKLYFIKEGYIRIGYIDEEGNEVIKEIIQQGELFGQFTLEKNNLNGEFAQAYKADVSLCAFNIEDFEKLLKRKPEIALKYTRQVGNKLRNVQNRLVNLLNKDVRARLLNFFWQLVQLNIGDDTTEGFCIPNYLTHEDIAHLVGSSRQTITTMINELATENLITYNRQQICFPDVKKIQKLVNVS